MVFGIGYEEDIDKARNIIIETKKFRRLGSNKKLERNEIIRGSYPNEADSSFTGPPPEVEDLIFG